MNKYRLESTFKKELKGKRLISDINSNFILSPYELNQIRFWINRNHEKYKLPLILPVSKRFVLDFVGWNNPKYNDVVLRKFRKTLFNY